MATVLTREFIGNLVLFALLAAAALWVITRSLQNAENRKRLVVKWLSTGLLAWIAYRAVPMLGVVGLLVLAICAAILSWLWAPSIGALVARPISSMFDGGNVAPEPRPLYSVAQAKQKRGEYLEAIAEIRRQLGRFPTDLEGHLLLAQIQAEDLNDLQGAEETILALCAQHSHAPATVAFALYSLADWYLQVARDRDAARRAFQQVINRLPGTEYALAAAQRIAHLANPDMPLDPHDRKFFVPEGFRHLGLMRDQPAIQQVQKDPAQVAADYVKHLEQHPLDTEAREQLAIIYADHYARLDLAADQLEQLIQMPKQPARLVVHWLNLLADLEIRSGAGYDAVRHTLQRIIDLAPNLAAAETARKRIDLLRLQLKALEQSKSVKLGSYEQNIGLKGGGRK
jgi:tetratricopeptide (TPR) repeat protein